MQLVILNSKDRFSREDLNKLEKYNPVFYETEYTKFDSIKEFFNDEEVVLGVQPDYIEGYWDGLRWEKVNTIKNLKGIALSTTSFGWVPCKELADINIPVTNVPGKSTTAVAEYYIFMMITLLRKLPLVFKNNWKSDGLDILGTNAEGLTIGVVGLGAIGSKIADLGKAFGMNVIYWNRSKKDSQHKAVELADLFKEADAIFITVAASPETKGLITKEHIDSMKDSAVILSAVEHFVYDYDYIIDKVGKKEIGGFAYEGEEDINKFEGNVFVAPEAAYFTKQTLEKESEIMTDSLISILEGNPINRVN